MVVKTSFNRLLSLPCMVNSLSSKGNDEELESGSGLFLFSHRLHGIYIITTLSASTDETESAHIGRNQDFSKAKVIFKVSGQLYTTTATKILQWKSSEFETELKTVFQPEHRWKLSLEKNESNHYDISILSTFYLYRIERQAVNRQVYNATANEAVPISINKVWPGAPVTTISYPFGPDAMEIFTGAASSGIVSNVCETDQGSMFMIDARCLPGSEGGGVYSIDEASGVKNLIGIIVSPMCWKSQELVGVSICCTLQHVLQRLWQSTSPHLCELRDYLNSTTIGSTVIPRLTRLCPVTVRIEIEGIWGSGVVCGAKLCGKTCQLIVATCKHVIEKKLSSDKLKVYITIEGNSKRYGSNILFATNETSAYDFALLNVDIDSEDVCKIVERLNRHCVTDGCNGFMVGTYVAGEFTKGMPVFTKGYGLFDASCDVGATFSEGTISNIVRHAGQDVLIHSTCLVHKGTSGGALVCRKTGKLIGITVNHVKDEEASVTYPDVNFSIPCPVFMPAVDEFLKTGDLSPFHLLNHHEDEVRRIWSLKPQMNLRDAKKTLQSKL